MHRPIVDYMLTATLLLGQNSSRLAVGLLTNYDQTRVNLRVDLDIITHFPEAMGLIIMLA